MDFVLTPWLQFSIQILASSGIAAGIGWYLQKRIETDLDVKLAKLTSDLAVKEHKQIALHDRRVLAVDELRPAIKQLRKAMADFKNSLLLPKTMDSVATDFTGCLKLSSEVVAISERHFHILPENIKNATGALLMQWSLQTIDVLQAANSDFILKGVNPEAEFYDRGVVREMKQKLTEQIQAREPELQRSSNALDTLFAELVGAA